MSKYAHYRQHYLVQEGRPEPQTSERDSLPVIIACVLVMALIGAMIGYGF